MDGVTWRHWITGNLSLTVPSMINSRSAVSASASTETAGIPLAMLVNIWAVTLWG